jgi:hypothetical protein
LEAVSRGLLLSLVMAAGCASLPGPGNPRPVPTGSVPSLDLGLPDPLPIPPDTVLLEQIGDALDLRLRDEFDRFLDGRDSGELLEHATLTQAALDRGIFGPDALRIVGDELFDYEFRPDQGLGNGLAGRPGIPAGPHPAPNLRRVHAGSFGGPDSHNCSSCHLKGGPDGAGNRTQNAFLRGDGRSTLRADERNPPHLLGLGPVAVLAREMTADLQRARSGALAEAARRHEPVAAPLASKGVSFGTIVVRPDGSADASRVEGVDPDLVVKPFGWKGHSASLPDIIEESFRIHMGLLSPWGQRRLRDGPPDPDQGDGTWYDADRDGVSQEVEGGMVTTLTAYLSQLEIPVVRPPATAGLLDRFARGRGLLDDIGCSSCHRPALVLEDPVLEIRSLDPEHADRPPLRVDVARDGDSPKVEPEKVLGARHIVRLFSDLKRHDMGPALATPAPQGTIPASVFLTRPLWGLAFTSPYLHDGRAPTVDDAIRLHGGEAAPSRDRYLELPEEDRASLQVFLLSLDREPKLFVP